jgi:DNA-binding MarR family transcriptional regulator
MMSIKKKLIQLLKALENIESEINLATFNETEKKVFYTVVTLSNDNSCNISDVINHSGLSRSSVYKSLKKLDSCSLITITQSQDDKREYILQPII